MSRYATFEDSWFRVAAGQKLGGGSSRRSLMIAALSSLGSKLRKASAARARQAINACGSTTLRRITRASSWRPSSSASKSAMVSRQASCSRSVGSGITGLLSSIRARYDHRRSGS